MPSTKVPVKKRLTVGILIGSILRFLAREYILSAEIPPVVPFDAPLHLSHDHILECKFLKNTLGLDMYNVGNTQHSCHVMPLVVSIFQYDFPFFVFVLIDVLVTLMLHRLATEVVLHPTNDEVQRMKEVHECNSRIQADNVWLFDVTSSGNKSILIWSNIPNLIALVYFCNPFTIMACCFQSVQSFCFLILVIALLAGRKGFPTLASACIAIYSCIEIYPFTYLVPVAFMLPLRSTIKQLVTTFAISLCFLLLISFYISGNSWDFAAMTYGWIFHFMDLQPNVGVFWYHFIMTFVRFKRFFIVLISGIPFLFFVPLSIRLHTQPLVLFALEASIWSLCKPHPTCHEIFLSTSFFLLSPHSIVRMRPVSFLSLISMSVPLLVLFIDYWLWLAGVGNANYLFFMGLTFMVFAFTIVIDFAAASVKHTKAANLTRKHINDT